MLCGPFVIRATLTTLASRSAKFVRISIKDILFSVMCGTDARKIKMLQVRSVHIAIAETSWRPTISNTAKSVVLRCSQKDPIL
jgi:hypothetical protein